MWEEMIIRGEVHLELKYLTGLRSVIRSSHTRYTQLETKIKKMSESDPITHCYIWDKSRTETMTQVNLERD